MKWAANNRFIVAFATLTLLGFAIVVRAGTTGKISGTVKSSDGTPLPGVAIEVVGLRLGAMTDADGRYVILAVPPGQHELRASMVGFQAAIMQNVRVSADRTTTASFTLREETIEVAPLVVTAGRPSIETDVTSSQTIVDARRVSEIPVGKMLDALGYEPGVSVARDNELSIRGGGPSEIRFQVDGLDRTDASTGKGYTQLNQTLVSEVTLLTGGFNAEYGNVRSGMVNVVTKDGTERRSRIPWVSGVVSGTIPGKKHFGPGAYDRSQYDYWTNLMSDSTTIGLNGARDPYGPIYWPNLYEETRNDTSFKWRLAPNLYKVFDGWAARANVINVANRRAGAYGKNDWTPEQLREAWQWEANMDEQVWQYGNEPDVTLDLAAGWALPRKMGGIVVGYVYKKEMTITPALRPYFRDQTFDMKLTLTPTEKLKIRLSYMRGSSASSSLSSLGNNAELSETRAVGELVEPTALRDASMLYVTLSGGKGSSNNKLSLSNSCFLDGTFGQWGVAVTYTFNPATYMTLSLARSSSQTDMTRDLPRVNVNASYDPANLASGYKPPSSFGYRGWLGMFYLWSDTGGTAAADLPSSLQDALTPGRLILNDPFSTPNYSTAVLGQGRYVTRTFFVDTPTPAVVVSPQGYIQDGYADLSGTYYLGTGAEAVLNATADQTIVKGDITHAWRAHTFKTGFEFITSELGFHAERALGLSVPGRNQNHVDYGGKYPTPHPSIFGAFAQDKYESQGLIANAGVRIERFDANYPVYVQNIFTDIALIPYGAKAYYDSIAIARGWNVSRWGGVPTYYPLRDTLRKYGLGDPPEPWDIYEALPHGPNKVFWRIEPRFGVSHPVSDRTKFFFNYGLFYSMQKPAVMFSFQTDERLGQVGKIQEIRYPNLRPARTTMYEVGIEHVLPHQIVWTTRGYAKYNVDQVSMLYCTVYQGNRMFRNANYEEVRGLEIKVARNSGRFLNGWFTYETYSTRAGEVGLYSINPNMAQSSYFTAYARSNEPLANIRGFVRLGTPRDWGSWKGGWGIGVMETYREGSEVIYRPDPTIPLRELPAENYMKTVDYWYTNLKLDKTIDLQGGRTLSAYMDVTNLLNTKYMSSGGMASYNDYLNYVFNRRQAGEKNLRVYDPSTEEALTRPYKDAGGNWKAPISPRTEWLLYPTTRVVRFGLRFDF